MAESNRTRASGTPLSPIIQVQTHLGPSRLGLVRFFNPWGKPVLAIPLHSDSRFTIDKVHNKTYSGKSRHICLRHDLLRQLLKQGVIAIYFVILIENLAGPLTKGLARERFSLTLRGMGLKLKTNKSSIIDNQLVWLEIPWDGFNGSTKLSLGGTVRTLQTPHMCKIHSYDVNCEVFHFM